MNELTIGIVGGSGFVGSVLANRLIERGYAVRIFTRFRDHARDCWLLPDTHVVEIDTNEQEQLNDAFAGCAAIVNLAGILHERGDNGEGFRRVHVDLAMRVAKACKHADVENLVHLSALGADSFAPSYYLRTKGEAEKLLLAEHGKRLAVTILRPSVIFGPHDDFTNRFARLVRFVPWLFPLARADARFQPVYVGDVADAIVHVLSEADTAGQRHDLGGPEIVTLGELVSYIARLVGHPVRILPLGNLLSRLQATVLEFVPGKPFSRDNLRSLQEDSICGATNALDTFGISATPMRVILPRYLAGRDARHRYYDYRTVAGRD
jgi:uncharacterized protein YbjT (DUF2867 family)